MCNSIEGRLIVFCSIIIITTLSWVMMQCGNDSGCECSSSGYYSCGTYSLKTCEDGCHWTEKSCNTICREGGYIETTGCKFDSSSKDAVCLCTGTLGGIGDACNSDIECQSDSCSGAGTGHGWCSRICTSTNINDCDGNGDDGQNSYGFYNFCVAAMSGDNLCFPGCGYDLFVCPDNYPGTTCQRVLEIYGVEVGICSLQ